MANTTNFNWETPDDTDLVKDGAAAIRTLGSAIDTSLVDLKGGTTDQVLAKNSNADMDFKWVADASGIPATIFDAKGDLIVASAADTAARFAVGGTNGHVLTVNSSATNGIEWAAPAGGSSGLTLVKTQTIGSGVSSVSVSNAFSSTYDNYLIVLSGGVASVNNWLLLHFGSTTTGYYHVNWYGDVNAAGPTGFAGSNEASMYFGSGSANSLNGQATIIAPNLAKRTNVYGTTMRTTTTSSKSRWLSYGGFENSDTQHTAFTLTTTDAGDGNGTLTGRTIKVFGYQNS